MNGAYTEAESEKREKPTRPRARGGAGKPQERLGESKPEDLSLLYLVNSPLAPADALEPSITFEPNHFSVITTFVVHSDKLYIVGFTLAQEAIHAGFPLRNYVLRTVLYVSISSPTLTRVATQGRDGNPVQWCLFDDWVFDCWNVANQVVRRGKPQLELNEDHKEWIRLQLAQPRTTLKKHLTTSVPLHYGLSVTKQPGNRNLSVGLLHEHRFIYERPADVKTVFHHPAIGAALLAVFFGRKGIGARYPGEFELMPIPAIALVCTILRHVIGEFRTGKWEIEDLCHTKDVGWYRGYVSKMEKMAQPDRVPNRIYNIQYKLGDLCSSVTMDGVPTEEPDDDIDFGSDSEAEDE
ncbi:hypothetical protein FRC06_010314, partial [Ceratobasidium sp. 370]